MFRYKLNRTHFKAAVVLLAGALIVGFTAAGPAAYAQSGGSGGGFITNGGSSGGGSFGGSSFGGGSYDHGGSTSFHHEPYESSSSSSWSSSSSSGGGGGGGGGGILPFVIIVGVVLLYMLWSWLRDMIGLFNGRKSRHEAPYRLVHIRLAFNALRTRDLRDAIEGIVRNADVKTAEGLRKFAVALSEEIVARREYVEYAYGSVEDGIEILEAQLRFQMLVSDARAYYKREVIRRSAAGLVETTRNSPAATELLDEDGTFGIDEFLVVTLIVCTSSERVPVTSPDAKWSEVYSVIEHLGTIKVTEMAGCEVIWTPAADSDILTRDDLLTGFRDLQPV